ncbi:Aldo/keto reductase [Fomitiporia mediterranea MF3/22]|uniref:Aldo/keto reductase n=1 Tax=Fomitiporia mediterranea (strain MF3/22) TaxID=694068 RepID=UPI0004409922|nr:Aldo/keto reductase [Fomitiporia mediterranea MF3/22]EJC98889.1 Aldo/keto reductase [Fomitiporia mediterranea MF3/22]
MPFGKIKLNDGNEIPSIAFGTGSSMKGKDVTEYVEQAIEKGFSHIDTAQYYQTEPYVGKAIREEGLRRDELFITTKFGFGKVSEVFQNSLKQLSLKQVDLYLIHSPSAIEGTIENTWREFEKIKDAGLAKSIGVSNFSVQQLKDLQKVAKIQPAVNQIRFHPYNWEENKELVEYAAQQGIVIEAYSSLTPITQQPGGPVDPVLKTIGKRLGATPAQVIFAWVKSKGAVIVTTTSKKERLDEYLAVGDLPELSEAEIAAIEEAGAQGGQRVSMNRRRFLAVVAGGAFFYGVRWLLRA